MRGGLREALPDALGNTAPFLEGNMHLFGIVALFKSESTQEANKVVGDIVLYGGTVTNSVDGPERGTIKAEMGVGFQGVPIVLAVELIRDTFAEVCLGCRTLAVYYTCSKEID